MASSRSFACAALGLLLLFNVSGLCRADGGEDTDEYEDAATALLVVRKHVKEELVIQGRNISVEITIHNAGAK